MAKVKFTRLRPGAVLPQYATARSSGFDFVAPFMMLINPGETELVPTGLAAALPEDTELQIRARSGKALNSRGYLIKNGIGTVDEDYRGEICIMIHNMGNVPLVIKSGEKIAQGVICPVIRCEIEEVDQLDDTVRGAGGFGSTGN